MQITEQPVPRFLRIRIVGIFLLLFMITCEAQERFDLDGTKIVTEHFEVTFPSIPTIEEINGGGLQSKKAEVQHRQSQSFCRCESIPLSKVLAGKFGKDELIASLNLRAQADGLSLISIRYSETSFGHKAVMRGHKTIRGEGATYETTCYVTESQVFCLMVGGMSSAFPSKIVGDFVRSLQVR